MPYFQYSAPKDADPNVEKAWESYRFACYGTKELSERQEWEVRQGFIAGIAWVFGFMRDLPRNDEESFKKVEQLHMNLTAFAEALRLTAIVKGYTDG